MDLKVWTSRKYPHGNLRGGKGRKKKEKTQAINFTQNYNFKVKKLKKSKLQNILSSFGLCSELYLPNWRVSIRTWSLNSLSIDRDRLLPLLHFSFVDCVLRGWISILLDTKYAISNQCLFNCFCYVLYGFSPLWFRYFRAIALFILFYFLGWIVLLLVDTL